MTKEKSIQILTYCAVLISIGIFIRLIFPLTYSPEPCAVYDKITTVNRYTGSVKIQHPKHYDSEATN